MGVPCSLHVVILEGGEKARQAEESVARHLTLFAYSAIIALMTQSMRGYP